MAKTPATYYVRIDTLWQNSPDRFVGPFASREEAEAEIERAANAPGSKIVLAGQLAADAKHAVRVYPPISRSEALRTGMREHGHLSNAIIGAQIPLNTDELWETKEEFAKAVGPSF